MGGVSAEAVNRHIGLALGREAIASALRPDTATTTTAAAHAPQHRLGRLSGARRATPADIRCLTPSENSIPKPQHLL